MPTTQTISIEAGPSEMQLMMSLMRPTKGKAPYCVDTEKGTSVHFTTGVQIDFLPAFSATIDILKRERCIGTERKWYLEGFLVDHPSFFFRGTYDSTTRKGRFNVDMP
jgi:hypothetical protein